MISSRNKRRLARKQSLPKDTIAETVHQAVCRHTNTDGFGCCVYYAVAGAALVRAVTGHAYLPQVGTLRLRCDPESEYEVVMDASRGGIDAGEHHAWIVGPVDGISSGLVDTPPDRNIIDFSARHYRRYVEEMPSISGNRARWRIAAPPKYIWTTLRSLPDWLHVSADALASQTVFERLDQFAPLLRLVGKLWRSR